MRSDLPTVIAEQLRRAGETSTVYHSHRPNATAYAPPDAKPDAS